jgi:hypothetical protein
MVITESIAIETAETIGTGTKARFHMEVETMTRTGKRMTAGETGRARITMGGRIGRAIEAAVIGGTTTTARAMILTEFGEILLLGLDFSYFSSLLTLDTDSIHFCTLVQLRYCIARRCIAYMIMTWSSPSFSTS